MTTLGAIRRILAYYVAQLALLLLRFTKWLDDDFSEGCWLQTLDALLEEYGHLTGRKREFWPEPLENAKEVSFDEYFAR